MRNKLETSTSLKTWRGSSSFSSLPVHSIHGSIVTRDNLPPRTHTGVPSKNLHMYRTCTACTSRMIWNSLAAAVVFPPSAMLYLSVETTSLAIALDSLEISFRGHVIHC
jgi:hypothetical protein